MPGWGIHWFMKLQDPRVEQSSAMSKPSCSKAIVRKWPDFVFLVWIDSQVDCLQGVKRWLPGVWDWHLATPRKNAYFVWVSAKARRLSWVAMGWAIYPRKWGLGHLPTLGNVLGWISKHMDWKWRSSFGCWKKGDECPPNGSAGLDFISGNSRQQMCHREELMTLRMVATLPKFEFH